MKILFNTRALNFLLLKVSTCLAALDDMLQKNYNIFGGHNF